MTISTAPAASGVNALWLSPLAATVNTRKNVPIASTVLFSGRDRPWRDGYCLGGFAARDDVRHLLLLAIVRQREFAATNQQSPECGPAVIIASSHLLPQLAGFAEFLLAATQSPRA